MTLCGVALVFLCALLLAHPINLANSDTGRHLKNGELFFQNFQVHETNLYSYTYPDFPTINHHWGGGVILNVVQQWFGFGGLSVFWIILMLATIVMLADAARRESGWAATMLAFTLFLPLITSRPEVRPETLSYLFTAIFLWLLLGWQRGDIRDHTLLITLPLLELLWVNLHIYFFLGGFLVFLFLIEHSMRSLRENIPGNGPRASMPAPQGIQLFSGHSTEWKRAKILGTTLILCGFASLINPAFIRGALAPLSIFTNFGYQLAENQSVWFLMHYGDFPLMRYYFVALGALVVSWLIALPSLIKRHDPFPIALLLLSITITTMAWFAFRNFALFGILGFVITAGNLKTLRTWPMTPWKQDMIAIVLILGSVIGLYALRPDEWKAEAQSTGIGLKPGNLAAADFMHRIDLRGPIFNNYDIGAYLIYTLYPDERVFVDNRPEAYPASFFTDELVPMQEKEDIWKTVDAREGFNAIIFYRRDLTEWGQGFMIRRVQDPQWAPVFVDDDILIFLRRNKRNAAIVGQYELPKSMFTVRR
ncbi:hypothetical protein HY285_01945 [Candidatus Peregrinibacteria bacterium]|nr:hypothetical protein [Candidatus Peregrinibacteria bacterium]MBI3816288.1 hypothetical protein [Candidatus Peregrinibacteria bacterium]